MHLTCYLEPVRNGAACHVLFNDLERVGPLIFMLLSFTHMAMSGIALAEAARRQQALLWDLEDRGSGDEGGPGREGGREVVFHFLPRIYSFCSRPPQMLHAHGRSLSSGIAMLWYNQLILSLFNKCRFYSVFTNIYHWRIALPLPLQVYIYS